MLSHFPLTGYVLSCICYRCCFRKFHRPGLAGDLLLWCPKRVVGFSICVEYSLYVVVFSVVPLMYGVLFSLLNLLLPLLWPSVSCCRVLCEFGV